ncbi:3-keto-5-aminohexanoate cleavage enzyme [Clostridium pasteurianum DSM 525 = ATCC 6013]|uniref:3-keto-5-aminohexanoate cleavage enzyme n=1 Tax=Clostridium pasteurianum DSM 525 = ATCC 6013 TaxID=1262449 RepID=A0A0H3J5F0_CLOPA|nr:3-keto-5-aminohexanoate cleavage protein [Clostridium pasteurianum]AJA49216.1 3-keto-5-aminohexanoate cleavage enzyme [Clostridium pasteurianum DSM 525 = ATCC 6013]AJA53204.1 3-keto-5-aminohexanoate cleavage enzyme [Clostridium pasteurianum DSM 525 = ATCC 6013]AOZ76398.1 3-keto-5-aminohexanoate cleavage protein [Clostridium pasteurianum DSM 525 = ATCC 6013]AOZ80195.1 3-keto-5-aminohexanoate cleavage protein [Clostridium pasteurianum]ELP59149.1 cytoplasmic protein [Clostridium pasteurianum D
MEKLIITAAICGAEVTKEQNPDIPYSVEEIAREAESAYKAGASIIHLHVREEDGTPTQDIKVFKKCITAIKEKCNDVIIQLSTGGAVGMSDDERLDCINLKPEMASLDCGTLNFGLNDIFVNTEKTINYFAKKMKEFHVKPEIEVFDKSMIDTALRIYREGLLERPLQFNFVMGLRGGTSATLRDLSFMIGSIPEGSTYTVTGVGRAQFTMAAMAIAAGGNVRVGFEDNIYIDKGILAKSNGQMVEKVVNIAKHIGRPVATPKEAREILNIYR